MSQTTQMQWMKWSQLPWLASSEAAAPVVQLCDRILQTSLEAEDTGSFFERQLPEIAQEVSVQWAGVVQRSPQWTTIAECGRPSLSELPVRFLEEALDRESGGCVALDDPSDWSMIAVPLGINASSSNLLLLAGRTISADDLAKSLAVGRALTISLSIIDERVRNTRRTDRLRTTLEIASSFADAREYESLLELIAREATRLLDCDRASIFILDRERDELVACPALGVEGKTLRLPADQGIVGEVIQSGRSIRVDNAADDPRHDKSFDESSGYVTQTLLCVPLRDAQGKQIGAFEGINKQDGLFDNEDEECLIQLGVQAVVALQNTREREQLTRSNEQLTEQVTQGIRLIGESPAIVALRETIQRLAATDLPVLILGESGTGKEVVAQSLHYQGPRSDRPFVAINCAALTETLLESELFGHEKGAFTDAHESRQGKFELAEEGTLFLDEIGDMSLGGQAKLLRVLEQKVITRVGGSTPIPINVRVIAATNTNLVEAVRNKKFREDLYYRLSVVTQLLPPLRERPEDILSLAKYFLEQFCVQAGRKKLVLTAEARRRLQSHSWPGNIRELRNLMERIAFLTSGEKVEAGDLAFILSPVQSDAFEPSTDMGLSDATNQFQQVYIRRGIKRVRGNMSEAARLLGLHRSNLYRKMRQLGMTEADDEEAD